MNVIPRLLIPVEPYRKIMAYTTLADGEITGFADVEYNKEKNAFIVGEVYLLPQEASSADVEIDEEEVGKFMLERVEAGATQMPRIWWHSHVEMPVFFSATDTDNISKFISDSYTISLVVNKKTEMKAQLNLWKPFAYEIEIPVKPYLEHANIPQELKDEVAEKVKPAREVVINGGGYSHNKDWWGEGYVKKNGVLVRDDANDEDVKGTSIIDELFDIPRGELPSDTKKALAYLKENKEDILVCWYDPFKEYVFWNRVENVKYFDNTGELQEWAEARADIQHEEFYGPSN